MPIIAEISSTWKTKMPITAESGHDSAVLRFRNLLFTKYQQTIYASSHKTQKNSETQT